MATTVGQQIKGEVRKLFKMAAIAAAGLVLLAIASLFTDNPAGTFFKVLSLLGTGLLLMSVALMIVTFRKAKAVVPGALIVSLLTTLATLGVQLLIANARPDFALGGLVFVAGILVGQGWSRTTLFFIDGDAVRSRGTAWYLAVWAATFLLNQLLRIFSGGVPAAGVVALLVATGIAAGNITGQLLRYRRATKMLSQAAPAGGTT